jgi:hypothetical protein
MGAQGFDSSPGRHPWPEDVQPVVFWEKPTHYAVVKPERLSEWEAKMAQMVGFSVERATDAPGLETTSFCGVVDGVPQDCDCDITHS